jgi:hypothetical protein
MVSCRLCEQNRLKLNPPFLIFFYIPGMFKRDAAFQSLSYRALLFKNIQYPLSSFSFSFWNFQMVMTGNFRYFQHSLRSFDRPMSNGFNFIRVRRYLTRIQRAGQSPG